MQIKYVLHMISLCLSRWTSFYFAPFKQICLSLHSRTYFIHHEICGEFISHINALWYDYKSAKFLLNIHIAPYQLRRICISGVVLYYILSDAHSELVEHQPAARIYFISSSKWRENLCVQPVIWLCLSHSFTAIYWGLYDPYTAKINDTER